jgi:hypothetical protein
VDAPASIEARVSPGRRSAPLWAEHDEWFARRDPFGRWRIVNQDGIEPLRDPDPVRQLQAAHLAAAAPRLLAMLEAIAGRLSRVAEDHQLDRRTRNLAREGLIAAGDSRPPFEELLSIDNAQLELVLEPGEPHDQVEGHYGLGERRAVSGGRAG